MNKASQHLCILAISLHSCAEDRRPELSPRTDRNFTSAGSEHLESERLESFGDGSAGAGTAAEAEGEPEYPVFLLRGRGTMHHKAGSVVIQRKLTYRIDSFVQKTSLDVTMAVSGDHTSQVNESLINSGDGANLEIEASRSRDSDFTNAERAGAQFVKHRAYIYANSVTKRNKRDGTSKTWQASQPLPVNVRPGARTTYESLMAAGGQNYVTQISGASSFSLHTRITVESLSGSEAVLKMTNSTPSDNSGVLMNGFPIPFEQVVTVDMAKKEIARYATRSYYLDGGKRYEINMEYTICAFKRGDKLTRYSLCNY